VSQAGYGPGSKTFSSVTEIGVWRTSCHPSLKQRMLTWQKCWLYGWFLAGGCEVRFQCQHSALSSSAYATLQTDTDKFAKLQLRFSNRLSATLFSDPLRNRNPYLGRDPYYGLIAYFTSRRCKACCADESRGTRWDDQKNEVITFSRDGEINTAGSTSSGELQTALLTNGFAK